MKSILKALLLSVSLIFSSGMVSYAQDFEKGAKAYKTGDYANAFKEWMVLAEQGDVTTQYLIGLMYDLGKGVVKDDEQAMKWWQKAAKGGNATAQLRLGSMYIPSDKKKARYWLSRSARQGNDLALKALESLDRIEKMFE